MYLPVTKETLVSEKSMLELWGSVSCSTSERQVARESFEGSDGGVRASLIIGALHLSLWAGVSFCDSLTHTEIDTSSCIIFLTIYNWNLSIYLKFV